MIEQKLNTRRFFRNINISLVSCFISLVISFMTEYVTAGITPTLITILPVSFFTGFLVPFILLYLNHRLRRNKRYKSLPFIVQMISGISLFMVITSLVFSLSILFFTRTMSIVIENLPWALIVGTIVALGLFFNSTLREFLGKGFWSNLIKGFYQQVRTEKAVIMFVDLKNSTRMGETLTPGDFFNVLNDFLRIVEMCCIYCNGDIYKYMGDGAILVWDTTFRGLKGALDFIPGFTREMKEKTDYFKEAYDLEIGYTVGIHSGRVLKGGLGSEKREMGYWGDTINTTSRIQGACKDYNVSFLLSRHFVQDLEQMFPEGYGELSFRSVGETTLRGKTGTHKLFTPGEQED